MNGKFRKEVGTMCVGDMFGGPSSKAAPAMTLVSAPPPTSVAKSMEDPSVRSARADDEKRRKLMQGQQSTQATGATGLGGGANLALGAKQVLGA